MYRTMSFTEFDLVSSFEQKVQKIKSYRDQVSHSVSKQQATNCIRNYTDQLTRATDDTVAAALTEIVSSK